MRIYLFIAAVAGGVTYLLTPLIRHIAIEPCLTIGKLTG